MINKTLLKQTFKINTKVLFSISGLISFFLIMMGVGFKIASSSDSGNSSLGSSNGIIIIDPSLIDLNHYNSSVVVQMIGMMFPMLFSILIMVYTIITANTLIASQVDKGSMAYTLSTPISRKEISLTQTFYFIASLLFMNIVVMLSSFAALGIVGETSVKQFKQTSLLSLGSFLLSIALGSILFMFSSAFNTSAKSFTFGGGFAILCYVFFMLGYMSDQSGNESLKWLKIFQYISLNGLFVPDYIIVFKFEIIYQFLAMALISTLGFFFANLIFIKRDLPL